MQTQKLLVLNYLENNDKITSFLAFSKFGITRLSAIIYELRQEGHKIETVLQTDKNRYGHTVTYAKYLLKKPQDDPVKDGI